MRTTRQLFVIFATIVAVAACDSSSSSEPVETPLAIWSSTGSESSSPDRAADAAIRDLIGVSPVLGEYMAGDNRSGEIEVFSPSETTPTVRSLLLMRQLGPKDEWSVIGAVNPTMTIDEPESRSIQTAGMLTVSGLARGFEGLVIVTAHRIADVIELIDQTTTIAGSLEESQPFRVELDLSGTEVGDVIAIVVRGGVGLEDDPGEFSALPIRIGG